MGAISIAKKLLKGKKKKKEDWDIPKVSKARKAELKKIYGKGTTAPYGTEEAVPLIEVSPQYSKHVDKVLYRGGAGMIGGSAAAAKIGSEYEERKKRKKNSAGTQTTKPLKKYKHGGPVKKTIDGIATKGFTRAKHR